MITFTCPSCQGKCQVADAMSGRKMKCPKCGTRIRHHPDGTIELLTLNPPPLPAPGAAPSPAATAPPAPDAAPAKESSAVIAHVAGRFLRQDERRQNAIVIWAVAGFLTLALAVTGMLLGTPVLSAGAVALFLAAAAGWLLLKRKIREDAEAQGRDEAKTERL